MKIKILILLILAMVVSIGTVQAGDYDVDKIEIPNDALCGEGFEFSHKYHVNEDSTVYSVIEISNVLYPVNMGEWNITLLVDDVSSNITENASGIFVVEEYNVTDGCHYANYTVTSLPNVMPGNYTVKLTMYSTEPLPEKEVVTQTETVYKKSRGGSGGYWHHEWDECNETLANCTGDGNETTILEDLNETVFEYIDEGEEFIGSHTGSQDEEGIEVPWVIVIIACAGAIGLIYIYMEHWKKNRP